MKIYSYHLDKKQIRFFLRLSDPQRFDDLEKRVRGDGGLTFIGYGDTEYPSSAATENTSCSTASNLSSVLMGNTDSQPISMKI